MPANRTKRSRAARERSREAEMAIQRVKNLDSLESWAQFRRTTAPRDAARSASRKVINRVIIFLIDTTSVYLLRGAAFPRYSDVN